MDDKKKKKRFYRPKQRKPVTPQSVSNSTLQRKEMPNPLNSAPLQLENPQPWKVSIPTVSESPQAVQETTAPTSQPTPLTTESYNPKALFDAIQYSPLIQKIRKNEADIQRLNETPVKDADGRWWSMAKAALQGLGQAFNPANPIRNEGDFYNRLSSVAGGAIGGAVNPSWNEQKEVQRAIAEKYQENEYLLEQANKEFSMQQKAATFATTSQKAIDAQKKTEEAAKNRSREIDLREGRNKFQKLRTEQQDLIKTIKMRGFYTEGENPELDKQLAELDVVLPDFNLRKPITKEQGGKFYQYDQDKESWFEVDEIPADESEVPIEFMVDNQRLMLRPRDIASIKSAEARTNANFEWQGEKNEFDYSKEFAKLKGELKGAETEYLQLSEKITELNNLRNNKEISKDTYETNKKEMEGRLRSASARVEAIKTEIANRPKPPATPKITVGQPNRVVGTEKSFNDALQRIKNMRNPR